MQLHRSQIIWIISVGTTIFAKNALLISLYTVRSVKPTEAQKPGTSTYYKWEFVHRKWVLIIIFSLKKIGVFFKFFFLKKWKFALKYLNSRVPIKTGGTREKIWKNLLYRISSKIPNLQTKCFLIRLICRVSPSWIIVPLFWTKYDVPRQIKPGIL